MLRYSLPKPWLLIFCICAATLIITYKVRNPSITYVKQNIEMPYFFAAKLKLLGCVERAAKIYYYDSTKFFLHFADCIDANIQIPYTKMEMYVNDFYGEKKAFLPMVDDFDKDTCNWLTVGVGGGTMAESSFRKTYPECSMFGAEPGDAGNFSSLGTVIPHGVGPEETVMELVVCKDNHYKKENVTVLTLTSLLDKFVGTRLLHYLTIDIEGIEYSVLETLVGSGKSARDGVQVCQIDAELHNPKAPNANPSIKNLNPVQFILNFLRPDSPYLPIFNVPYRPHPHQKVTFINVEAKECEEAFMFSKYFVSNQ